MSHDSSDPDFIPQFSALDTPGLSVYDPINTSRFIFPTATAVTPTPTTTDEFLFPIETAVTISTTQLTIPKSAPVIVRSADGTYLTDTSQQPQIELDEPPYLLELTATPMKLYLWVPEPAHIESIADGVQLTTTANQAETSDSTPPLTLTIGARSFHDEPAATIATPPTPTGIAEALTYFGSAIKTPLPERSFPTLRGHPPLLKLDETCTNTHVPDVIQRQHTPNGIEIIVPAEWEYVYPVAPLAYYLSASVSIGHQPRIETPTHVEQLPKDFDAFADAVCDLLQHVFTLDCVVRTEGIYEIPLAERTLLEKTVDDRSLDCAALYEQPLAERLVSYLDIDTAAVEKITPTWPVTMTVAPEAESATVLPFTAADLSIVRCSARSEAVDVTPMPDEQVSFFRGSEPSDGISRPDVSEFERDDGGSDDWLQWDDLDTPTFQLPSTDSWTKAWVGDGFPLRATAVDTDALHRRFESNHSTEKRPIRVHVVCNDSAMAAEDRVAELYGTRDWLEFDVTVSYELTRAELRDVLQTPVDFLHFIGHVNEDGLQCRDGYLDVTTATFDVEVVGFLLNACQSYEQGAALIERGSRGGVVTISPIANTAAVELGEPMALFLNAGFPLQAAIELVREQVPTNSRYVTVGDGWVNLCQSVSGVPVYVSGIPEDGKEFSLTVETIPAFGYELGSMHTPVLESKGRRYLASGSLATYTLTEAELDSFFEQEQFPLFVDGTLYWSNEVTATQLREKAAMNGE